MSTIGAGRLTLQSETMFVGVSQHCMLLSHLTLTAPSSTTRQHYIGAKSKISYYSQLNSPLHWRFGPKMGSKGDQVVNTVSYYESRFSWEGTHWRNLIVWNLVQTPYWYLKSLISRRVGDHNPTLFITSWEILFSYYHYKHLTLVSLFAWLPHITSQISEHIYMYMYIYRYEITTLTQHNKIVI